MFLCRYTLIGVTSFGNESDVPGNSTSPSSIRFLFPTPTKYCVPPAIFARVSEVKQWIIDNAEGAQDSNMATTA